MKDIYIIGDGGFAKEVAFLIEEINRNILTWNLKGFISLNKEKGESFHNSYIVGDNSYLAELSEPFSAVIAIGNPFIIRKIHKEIGSNTNCNFCNLIHPSVIADWNNLKIGDGNIITAGVILTTNITIGTHNIFNLNTTVGHDTVIGSYNVFNPACNISGNVEIENESLFGTGCQVLQNISLSSNITVGAGAVVTKDIVEEGVYIGIPAKKVK